MTKITFFQNEKGKTVGFCAAEHAGYAEEGRDVVCAAVSALVITCVNAMERLTDDQVDCVQQEEEAMIRLTLAGDPSEKASLLLQALSLGLSEIEESYPDYLDILFEEV